MQLTSTLLELMDDMAGMAGEDGMAGMAGEDGSAGMAGMAGDC